MEIDEAVKQGIPLLDALAIAVGEGTEVVERRLGATEDLPSENADEDAIARQNARAVGAIDAALGI